MFEVILSLILCALNFVVFRYLFVNLLLLLVRPFYVFMI